MSIPSLPHEIIAVVQQQIREHNPPETEQAFARLLRAGHPRQVAIAMLAAALVEEVQHMLNGESGYDHARYARRLERLK